MRGGFPIDVARALQYFVRTNPIEVVTLAAVEGRDLTFEREQQIFETGLRIDGWINQYLAQQRNVDPALGESERKSGGEAKAVLAIGSTVSEQKLHGFFHACAARDNRKVERERE